MITLIGMGAGLPGSLTAEGLAALQQADLIVGARRLLEHLPDGCTEHRKALYKPEEILTCLAEHPEGDTALLYSGDTGFYSGASGLLPMLRACGISCRVLPGISSVQLLAAAVGRPWQDWKLVSAHGCACDPVAECLTADGRPVFFLTGGSETPATLCRTLTAAGLGQAHALVGEQLGTPEEKIFFGTAQEVSQKNTASLSVLLIESYFIAKFFCDRIFESLCCSVQCFVLYELADTDVVCFIICFICCKYADTTHANYHCCRQNAC